MLKTAVRNTRKLVREKSQEENIRLGRFFTKKDTAALMADMLTFSEQKTVKILDPGAGTGILSAALLDALGKAGTCKDVALICYENNAAFLPMLKRNLEQLRKRSRRLYGMKVAITLYEDNYILASGDSYSISFFSKEADEFDYVIMNPPSELMSPKSPEALCVKDVCSGTTDLCYLFLAMAANSLKVGGQMVTVLPTAFATAVQQTKIRCNLFAQAVPDRIALFAKEDGFTLKKQMIIKLHKGLVQKDDTVTFSVSTDDGTPEHTTLFDPLPYTSVVKGDDCSLLLSADPTELKILKYMQSLPFSFGSYGLKMKTGLTLLARYKDALHDTPTPGAIPLIHPSAISNGRVVFPSQKKAQFITPVIPSLAQKNRNMLLIKRVPAKSDKRKLMCGVYMASQLSAYPNISTHNKLNYIDTVRGGEMDAAFLYGLYAFLSSTLCDTYIRIVSKSKQINSRELADLPLPAPDVLRRIGAKLISVRVYTLPYCDKIVNEVMQISITK